MEAMLSKGHITSILIVKLVALRLDNVTQGHLGFNVENTNYCHYIMVDLALLLPLKPSNTSPVFSLPQNYFNSIIII